MRRTSKSLVLAGVLAVGGLASVGATSAQAQGLGGYPGPGYGGYPVGGAYVPGYPVGPAYGPGYGGSGGVSIGVGVGGYPAPIVGGYPGYGYGGFRGGYVGGGYYHHHHHRHYRGCGCRY
jgi:hypothetical protein